MIFEDSGFGTPEITAFQGGRSAALSLQFDDSMESQIKNALPLLNARRLPATFFINPGQKYYASSRKIWEGEIVKAGHELGNHTFTHKGAKNVEEAEREIRGCAEVIARVYGNRSRLTPFAYPGGVPWNVPHEEQLRLYAKFLMFSTVSRQMFADGWGDGDPTSFPAKALRDRSWIQMGMHGVGGEWISTSVPNLTRLLDYLVAHQSEIWTATTSDVYKYTKERAAARPLSLTAVTERGFTLGIDCDERKIETFGKPFGFLYDMPLTIRVPVPPVWRVFTLKQGASSATGKTFAVQGKTFAQFDVLPNAGFARITKI